MPLATQRGRAARRAASSLHLPPSPRSRPIEPGARGSPHRALVRLGVFVQDGRAVEAVETHAKDRGDGEGGPAWGSRFGRDTVFVAEVVLALDDR
jgi:hypothetical protein